ncbi:MAG: dihydroorotase, partial [Actinobacteria bacterium]|nr:dihydroorotase [Actinomycetota bacterium]
MRNYLIKSATLADGTITDVVVSDGSIKSLKAEDGAGLEIIDAKGLMLFGGFVDMHTHLREPGFEQSETILSGSKAAAKGGFTGVNAMANTSPVADNAAVVELVSNLGKQAGYVEVQPIGAVTKNLHGEQLADLASMNSSSANVRVFSDDGNCVSDSLLMRRALEYVRDFGGTI